MMFTITFVDGSTQNVLADSLIQVYDYVLRMWPTYWASIDRI